MSKRKYLEITDPNMKLSLTLRETENKRFVPGFKIRLFDENSGQLFYFDCSNVSFEDKEHASEFLSIVARYLGALKEVDHSEMN